MTNEFDSFLGISPQRNTNNQLNDDNNTAFSISSQEFWSFDDLITARILPLVFKFALVAIGISAIIISIICGLLFFSMLYHTEMSSGAAKGLGTIFGLFVGAFYFFFAALASRLSFEALIVVFKIWQNSKQK